MAVLKIFSLFSQVKYLAVLYFRDWRDFYMQGGHGTKKTGDFVFNFSGQGKHGEFKRKQKEFML